MSNELKIREETKNLNPIDDLMFRKMAEDAEFCEEILRVFLEDTGLKVLESVPQYVGTNLQGRSVIFDAKCTLGDGRTVGIEVQKSDNDDHQRRVRYNGAILTTNIMDPGEKFEKVPDVCIVFLSKFDLFRGNRALYHVDRVLQENGRVVSNGFEEIYVNARVKDGSEAAELMEVFVSDTAYNDKFPVTSASKRRYKETEEGQKTMSGISERIWKAGREEGREEERLALNRLCAILLEQDRLQDLKRAVAEPGYQEQLLAELVEKEE